MNTYPQDCFINRELSWLSFNTRVLGEAGDPSIPLFERLKFLGITASNLDEFLMIRVASLKDMVHADYEKPDLAGLTPKKQLKAISARIHDFCENQYDIWNLSLLPELAEAGLTVIRRHEELDEEQSAFCDEFFHNEVYPALTPMAVDSSRPFPLISNKSLNIGALLREKEEPDKEPLFATVQVPAGISRIVELPASKEGKRCVILLEEIIERNMHDLFFSYDIVCAHPYRIMRNADLSIDEDEAVDLLQEIEKQVRRRKWGEVIRLEADSSIEPELADILLREFKIKKSDMYLVPGPLDLTFLMKVYSMKGFDHLKDPGWQPYDVPELPAGCDLFEKIREKDRMLSHPYETFRPVIDFVRQAANDPQVLAIKQTLYRVSGNSPVIAALAEAAENGKQVSVLVELKARFDEENNISWARKLEKAGCHVIYGLVGLKTHCKITLVVRREEDGIRRYVHLGTGNYNDNTAKLYTDMGLFTCSPAIGEDATAVFNMLSGYSRPKTWNRLVLAPFWLRNRFLELIAREKEHAENGRPAGITAKMNSLCDKEIIEALYDASQAGVKVKLLIRGICCLRPGVPDVSEHITVRSIVGTFLEHSRIYCFVNGGEEEIYMGSCDWMPRNLDRRVEILFPVEAKELKERIRGVLAVLFEDNTKAHEMSADGLYRKPDPKECQTIINAQMYFCEQAKMHAEEHRHEHRSEPFIVPNTSID